MHNLISLSPVIVAYLTLIGIASLAILDYGKPTTRGLE